MGNFYWPPSVVHEVEQIIEHEWGVENGWFPCSL